MSFHAGRNPELTIRDATASDLADLCAVGGSQARHRDRIAAAEKDALRYLVAEQDGLIVAFSCLIFAQPDGWPEIKPLPKIVALCVHPDNRNRGIGETFVRHMEGLTHQHRGSALWVSVDPEKNPRALAFYRRLGYRPLSEQWQWVTWDLTDSAGRRHAGEGWDMTLSRCVGDSE